MKIIEFFQARQAGVPGDWDYNAAFCQMLAAATSAKETSVWQLDNEDLLHLVYGSNVKPQEVKDVTLRQGEGISGAAALSRRAIAFSDTLSNQKHDRRVDERIGFLSHSMVSAPILFGDFLYGVVNILNHTSGRSFPNECQEYLAAAGALYAAALAVAGRLSLYQEYPDTRAAKKERGVKSVPVRTTIVGVSPAVLDKLDLCLKAGRTNVPVLLRGETGTGKELAALRIHEASDRATGLFLDVNCASLSETLLESELFGHVKGAFSGANRDRPGKFVEASEGTLFLDEIGEMTPACQAKILRALQEKKVTPLGSEKSRKCDARLITATNRILWDEVKRGNFREDLYYRICGIEILMPPLRERTEDIPLLVDHFLKKASAEQRPKNSLGHLLRISAPALEMLMSFSWPGNVRQLEQAVLAAAAVCQADKIQPGDFPAWLHRAVKSEQEESGNQSAEDRYSPEPSVSIVSNGNANKELAKYMQALGLTKYPGTGRWNLAAAARKLNIPRKTLTYRLKKLRIIK